MSTVSERKAMELALTALRRLEWFQFWSGIGSAECLWCRGYERHPAMDQDYYGQPGHKADCPRQVAIAALTEALLPEATP